MNLPERAIEHAVSRWTAPRRARSDDGLPPGPGAPPLVQLLMFLLTPGELLRACRERYGKAFTLRMLGLPPLVQLSDPDAVREVFALPDDTAQAGKVNALIEPVLGSNSLIVMDGAPHRAQRPLLLPPFRGERMRAYGQATRDITSAEVARWPRGTPFVMHEAARAITLDVILRTVFGMRDGADQSRMRDLLRQALHMIDNPLMLVRALQRDVGAISPWGRFVRVRAAIYEAMDALVARRRREGLGEDILSILLEATHEDGTPMSEAEIRDELLTLLFAGHETTATALTWAMHRLSIHPDVLARVQGEVDAVGDPVGARELRHLDAVCKETLRIHPVIGAAGRVLVRPTRVGGLDLPAGVGVACSIYLVHSDPSVWPDPTRFDPERFLDRKPSANTYFPFGGGLRRCIGEAFALYQMRIILATLLAEVEPVAVARDVRARRRSVALAPSDGLPIAVRSRRGPS